MVQLFKDSWAVWRRKKDNEITEIEKDVEDVETELEGKIDAPASGTAGQVLTKTSTGVAWQDGGGGTTLYWHTVNFNYSYSGLINVNIIIISSHSTAYTKNEVKEFLSNGGKFCIVSSDAHTSDGKLITPTYLEYSTTSQYYVMGTQISISDGAFVFNSGGSVAVNWSQTTITDTVTLLS